MVASSRGLDQSLLQLLAYALLPELLGDVAASVDEDISHIPTRVLVAGDDKVPGSARIRYSIGVRECFGITPGIAEDDELLTWNETVDKGVVDAWPGPSVHLARSVAPDSTCMIGHRFVDLLFSSQRTDASVILTINGFNCIQADMSVSIPNGKEGHGILNERGSHNVLPSVRKSQQLTEGHPGRIGVSRLLPGGPNRTPSRTIRNKELQAPIAERSGGQPLRVYLLGSWKSTE